MKKQHTRMDVLVLLAVIALIAGVFVKFYMVRSTRQESVSFTYTMEIPDPDSSLAEALQPGDIVYDIQGKAVIGQISGVEQTENGLLLTLAAEGFPKDGGYRVGVYDILPTYSSTFFAENGTWDGVILSVS